MSQRNVSLDIVRAAAIIVVVNCHSASAFAGGVTRDVFGLGGKGVDLFFVLSGWLLGTQLLTELRESGTIDTKRFWSRRWFRTLPAYYTILLITYSTNYIKNGAKINLNYLTFTQNYLDIMPYFGISWSLCVEEYFYLLIAPLLLLASRSWGKVLLALLFCLPSVARSLGVFHSLIETHVRWDQCGVGVLMASLNIFAPIIWKQLCRIAPLLALIGLCAVGFEIFRRVYPDKMLKEFGILGWALISASFVLLAESSDFWRSRLRFRPAMFVAERAYSLYLVHVEAIAVVRRIGFASFPTRLALTWALSFLLAEMLHSTIELPMMRVREFWPWSRSRQAAKSDVPKINYDEVTYISHIR